MFSMIPSNFHIYEPYIQWPLFSRIPSYQWSLYLFLCLTFLEINAKGGEYQSFMLKRKILAYAKGEIWSRGRANINIHIRWEYQSRGRKTYLEDYLRCVGSLLFSPYAIPISTCWDSGGEDVLILSNLRGERNDYFWKHINHYHLIYVLHILAFLSSICLVVQ